MFRYFLGKKSNSDGRIVITLFSNIFSLLETFLFTRSSKLIIIKIV